MNFAVLKRRRVLGAVALSAAIATSVWHGAGNASPKQIATLHDSREVHLKNVKQLTFGGQNAEAYFSPDGKRLIFQSERGDYPCDQEYTMNIDGSDTQRVSNGQGRTTCGWWLQGGKRLLFSSTHEGGAACPEKPDFSKGYVWPLYDTYRIYTAKPDGTDLQTLFPKNLAPNEKPGYNAEAVVSRNGKKIVFCSTRGGDLDIWTMDSNGKNIKQITRKLGYEGGPWWSPDGKQICFRAFYPETEKEIADYKSLLAQNLIRPTTLDLYVMNADGSDVRRITNDKAARIANFGPSWTPDGKSLVFCTNRSDEQRRKFEVFKINLDGSGLERITYGDQFDGFPNFSPNGKYFVWASNRNGKVARETNLFIAEWVP
jgi:Tol biopolymer transport system component